MKHLFIVNPAASRVKGAVGEIVGQIEGFFGGRSDMRHDIHITRWTRDASGFVRRYVMESGEMVRIHCFGGSGTLFEVVNGAAGLPNAQIASYPFGSSNEFINYFGRDKARLFCSLALQVSSGVTPIDVIRNRNNHGISHVTIGLEARTDRDGAELVERTFLPTDICYLWPAVWEIISKRNMAQNYKIDLDGKLLDGKYMSILISNGPCYGANMSPAVEAHPNDGRLEVYLMSDMSKFKLLSSVSAYTSGNYRRIPERIRHYSGKRIKIASEDVMCVCFDGEAYYEKSVLLEVIPYAVDFVCPQGIDVNSLPRIYNHPEEGYLND